jgi:hypothetical protein
MGVVYEAVQTSLGRHVALKVLGPALGLTPQAVARFRRAAAAATVEYWFRWFDSPDLRTRRNPRPRHVQRTRERARRISSGCRFA